MVKKNVWLQIRDNSSTGNLLGWRWQVHKGSLFPNTFSQILCCLGKKKKRKHPVPFPNKVFIWVNSGHIICSKITDTKFDSSVRSWLDLVAMIQCHTNAAELFTGSTSLEKHDNHHYCITQIRHISAGSVICKVRSPWANTSLRTLRFQTLSRASLNLNWITRYIYAILQGSYWDVLEAPKPTLEKTAVVQENCLWFSFIQIILGNYLARYKTTICDANRKRRSWNTWTAHIGLIPSVQ